MKHFKITVKASNQVQEFTSRQYIDALYAVNTWVNSYGFEVTDSLIDLELQGAKVDSLEFMNACEMGFNAWLENKKLTHKKVKCLHGSSVSSFVYKWVKK
jgi:hypothetical protein